MKRTPCNGHRCGRAVQHKMFASVLQCETSMYNIFNRFLRSAQLEFSGNPWLCWQVKLFSGESQGKLDFCSIHESRLMLAHTVETFPLDRFQVINLESDRTEMAQRSIFTMHLIFNVFQSLSVIVVTCLGFIKDQEKRRFVFFSCYFFCFCLDFLVSIKAILLRTTNTHQAYVHSGDAVLSYSFYNKRKLVNSCFWLCFFFFSKKELMQESCFIYLLQYVMTAKNKKYVANVCVWRFSLVHIIVMEGLRSVSSRRFVWESVPDFKPYCP